MGACRPSGTLERALFRASGDWNGTRRGLGAAPQPDKRNLEPESTRPTDFFRTPELATICAVPLLDMVRHHRFLLAKFWVPEYGSSEDPKQSGYICKYSPNHRVKAGTKYPAVLVVTGDADTRVDPLHARKMTALVRNSTGSSRPVLLRYDTTFGHTRAQPLDRTVADVTHDLKFLMWQVRHAARELIA